jgi:hypothetical protein
MSQPAEPTQVPWLERWRETREALVNLLRRAGFVPADHYGTRRDNAAAWPHIGILREQPRSAIEEMMGVLTADWIGTAYFPMGTHRRVTIEVFGASNLADARRIAWRLRSETGLDVDARLAHPRNRREEEDCPRISNVDNWGPSFG